MQHIKEFKEKCSQFNDLILLQIVNGGHFQSYCSHTAELKRVHEMSDYQTYDNWFSGYIAAAWVRLHYCNFVSNLSQRGAESDESSDEEDNHVEENILWIQPL